MTFWGKKFGGLNLGQMDQKLVPKLGFCLFLKFGSLVFLEIAYDDNFQQYLTSSTSKIYEKNFWAQILAKETKIGAKTKFFWHFLKFGSLVFFEIANNDSFHQYLTSSRGKVYEKKSGVQI